MHGAAMLQIAEHPSFTSINAFRHNKQKSSNAYVINDSIGIYLKYASQTHGSYDEFGFTFNDEHMDELQRLSTKRERTFVVLVCWEAKEVCCLTYEQLREMIQQRQSRSSGSSTTNVYVQAPPNSRLRVYTSAPGSKNHQLGEVKIPRSEFPGCLF